MVDVTLPVLSEGIDAALDAYRAAVDAVAAAQIDAACCGTYADRKKVERREETMDAALLALRLQIDKFAREKAGEVAAFHKAREAGLRQRVAAALGHKVEVEHG